MAAKIAQRIPTATVEQIPSSGGVFEIMVDNKLIYSKKATGEFPSEFAILDMLEE